MQLHIKHQDTYSRGELLLRSFFGIFYIIIPHFFILYFLAIWGGILAFISFWAIMFTGAYPRDFFEYRVKLYRWVLRINSRIQNLADGYPAFGLNTEDDSITFNVPYPEKISRANTLLKLFFGFFYIIIPHVFILYFRFIWAAILGFIAWWSILLTGKFPKSFHDFIVANQRWSMRVNLAMSFMTDEYPPFHGRPDHDSGGEKALDQDVFEEE
jgi:hypothetical protein